MPGDDWLPQHREGGGAADVAEAQLQALCVRVSLIVYVCVYVWGVTVVNNDRNFDVFILFSCVYNL